MRIGFAENRNVKNVIAVGTDLSAQRAQNGQPAPATGDTGLRHAI